eukprot:TRINITY_DN48585_c0_g1_i1.p2 TRINITY_DN48585_c0_g1~~TRINITY_DN48585_c0_g1_i1.p2  ORF type:complete len:105 (+),score=21.47 TRINITY_DN48585_c0_g1_i1:195-509(+)
MTVPDFVEQVDQNDDVGSSELETRIDHDEQGVVGVGSSPSEPQKASSVGAAIESSPSRVKYFFCIGIMLLRSPNSSKLKCASSSVSKDSRRRAARSRAKLQFSW